MKRSLLYFFMTMAVTPAAVAAVADAPSRALPASVTGDAAASRATVSRTAVTNNTDDTNLTSRSGTGAPARSVSTAVSRAAGANNTAVATTTSPRDGATTVSRGSGASRSSLAMTTRVENDARTSVEAAAANVGMNSRVSAATLNNTAAVRRAGVTLRPTTAEVGGRATIAGTDMQTGSNIASSVRSVSARAATNVSKESITEARERLEQTASLNKSCQEQYNECMDQFCAVIDANQKRCSCSANLSRYTKVESAVKDANTQLNEVAQRIRYVGLSADEIRAILTATEAEDALTGTRDTTETRNMLEAIEDLIKDPSSATSYYADNSSGWDLDLSLDFSDDTSDIFSLDFLNNNNNSFSNLRGTSLYNAAKKRCNTVLTQCKEVGATSQQITGNYDLAIDKDCIAYEQGLTKMNETLVSNVRSAQRMLQKARLAVLQNKNQYDAKGCIAALDACMTDDMVCGSDYYKCLDPTKAYIDENGTVVLGKDVTQIRKFMAEYNNAGITQSFLTNAYAMSITDSACSQTIGTNTSVGDNGACNVKYLLTKIGTKQKVTDEGLCRAVLDKCQRYTYDDNGNYKSYNDVVVNYIQRAMVNIKAAQEKIISDYASTCMTDIAACYNQQVTQVNAWSSSASVGSIYNVMRGACRNVALTCGYAVFDKVYDDTDAAWPGCKDSNTCKFICEAGNEETCLEQVSQMFYQSLLCPDNSDYVSGEAHAVSANGTPGGYVNARCKCRAGYEVYGSNCLVPCDDGKTRNSSGGCS